MAAMLKSITLLALVALPALASAKTLSLPIFQPEKRNIHARSKLARRASGTASVSLGNDIQNGLYYVNATVGTPGQIVQLQIDTGSSDIWMFSPSACSEAQCLGGSFNIQKSTSATILERGGFSIQYGTPGSGVQGDYFSDDFAIGDIVIKNLTQAVATEAKNVPTGIMGIGFDLDESITQSGTKPYPNIADVMVTQGLISTRSYSLYLDDLQAATGNVLFGGYDTEKYTGSLETLEIQPDSQTGTISTMTIALTSIGIEDGSGSQTLTKSSFAEPALLDSGTTLTLLPTAIYQALANYFEAQEDAQEGIALVNCDTVQKAKGSVNFGFGGSGGPVIKVPYSEFALPIYLTNGQPATFNNGDPACAFGMQPQDQASLGIILGDTMLRSAYIVYDLDNKQIAIAQSSFNSQSSNIKEIGKNTPGNLVSGGVTVTQSGSAGLPPGIQTSSAAAFTSTPLSGGVTLTGSGIAGATGSVTGQPGAAATSKSAASSVRPEGPVFSVFSFSMCAVSLLSGVAFMAFR